MKPAQWLIPMKGLSTEPDTRSENEKKISDEWDASVAVSPVKVTQSQSAEEETTMDPKTGEYTTTIKKPEVKSKAVYTPEDPGEYRMAPKPDTFEQKYSAVEEMLRPSEGGSILDRTSTATIENPYKLQNMGVSSVFAKDWLRKSGLPVSQEGLDTAFRIYSAGVQKPSIKSKDGRIDLYATREDQNRYEAELQKKSSEFMKDIISGNTTSIAEKVSQENLTMAQAKRKEEAESAEADIAGRRTDGAGNNFRPVSKEEATKGRMMSEAYRDLAAARNIPDAFPKAMQAATSKLKANSVPVTMDNIVGELVSQGSIPSKSAITIKSLLGNGTGVADLTSKFFLETGSQLVMDDNRTDAYIKQNLKDMTDGLASVGFNPPETKVEVETGGKKETAPSKMVSAKKTAKPGSVGAPILYTKGMKTEKGKYYNVNGKLVLSKGGN
jgi:hypothetical protein